MTTKDLGRRGVLQRWIGAVSLGWLVTLTASIGAQGTKQWTVDRFDELQRGTADGVAIRSDGHLEVGLTSETEYIAEQSYVWSLASARDGSVIAGIGGSSGGAAAAVRVKGKASAETIFKGNQLGVQAVKVAEDGTVFLATSPDGKVYRLGQTRGSELVVFDSATTAERSKYIWDLAVGRTGDLYVATGAPAAVYRISATPGAKPELLFRTADAHIRSLLMSNTGVLWAGSDGAGVIYRFDTTRQQEKPFAAYASGHREITAMTMDNKGNLYAAAVGSKTGSSSLPPFPVTGAVGVTVTFLQPGSASAAVSNSVVPDGSEIDRISADGLPEKLVQLKDNVVYGLAIQGEALLAATGNRGRIFRIDTELAGRLAEVARVDAGQATAMIAGQQGPIVGTSNAGKVVVLQQGSVTPSYTSEVFDAGQYAQWGRLEMQAAAQCTLFLRTGNVPNPVEGWSSWTAVRPGEVPAHLPLGRYAQWKAELKAGEIDRVTLNYLPRNVAPVVDELVAVPGARLTTSQGAPPPATVQVVFPGSGAAAQAISYLQQDSAAAPLTAQKDRSGIVFRWSAHDDNGDDLMFSVWTRGVGERTWHLLKDKVSDRFLSLDASLLPDGQYEAKVIASDAPEHIDTDTLTGERTSAAFIVDTTPPVAGTLAARVEGATVRWTFDARDTTSPISHAEFSLDAGPWQYVEPVGKLSDSLQEHYDVRVPLSNLPQGESSPDHGVTEHLLAVRVYDRSENMTSVKTVVH